MVFGAVLWMVARLMVVSVIVWMIIMMIVGMVIVVIVNLLVDLAYGWLNPKVRTT